MRKKNYIIKLVFISLIKLNKYYLFYYNNKPFSDSGHFYDVRNLGKYPISMVGEQPYHIL